MQCFLLSRVYLDRNLFPVHSKSLFYVQTFSDAERDRVASFKKITFTENILIVK